MHHIVAVEVTLADSSKRYFLTWGRIHDAVDPKPLEELVLHQARNRGLKSSPVSTRLCQTLAEAAGTPFFFECFFDLCQQKIPFGEGYASWAEAMRKEMEEGHQLYLASFP